MNRVNIFNNVRTILAVFVAFEVLYDEDKNQGKGKTRQWIRRTGRKGNNYFNNIVKELSIEDTAEYKEIMRISYADFQRILSYIEEDITRKQVLCFNKVIPPKERLALTNRFLATGETMIKVRCKRLQLRFNIPNIPENKINVESVDVEAKFKAFKLFQHRFDIVSTLFNTFQRG